VNNDEAWFAPKRYGMGPGVPISWQGWALTLGYVSLMVFAVLMLMQRPLQLIAVLIPITVTFLVIAGRTTRGGWRWRWGEDE